MLIISLGRKAKRPLSAIRFAFMGLLGSVALAAPAAAADNSSFSAYCTGMGGTVFGAAKVTDISSFPLINKFVILASFENEKTAEGLFFVDPANNITMSKIVENAFLLGTRVDACFTGESETPGVGKHYNLAGVHSRNR